MVEADDSERVRDDGAAACSDEWTGEGVYQYVFFAQPFDRQKVPEAHDVDELL